MKISGTFKLNKWDEKPYDVIENRMKSTKTTAEFIFTGDIEGIANVESLMFYKSFDLKDPHKAEAQYVGLVKITGKLKGKSGSFTMIDHGEFESGVARSSLTIIPGSGTGELSRITGSGSYTAGASPPYTWEMSINL